MRFSIIIPAHNSENHIRKALESIKSQTFTDYELIVICDSCNDNTQKVAEEYGAITERVGFGRDGLTRNRGLAKAKGDWVLFMDDDDWWLHEYVLEQLRRTNIGSTSDAEWIRVLGTATHCIRCALPTKFTLTRSTTSEASQ